MVKTFYRTGQLRGFQVSYMHRMHIWYKRACRLELTTIYAPHDLDVLGLKGMRSMISQPYIFFARITGLLSYYAKAWKSPRIGLLGLAKE